MPPGRQLKVYEAQLGFYDTVVAAPNQKAALKAWGSRLNLFGLGLAKVSTDEAAAAAAREHPETPLVRAVGSNDPFRLKATSVPKIPKSRPKAVAEVAAPAETKPLDGSAARASVIRGILRVGIPIAAMSQVLGIVFQDRQLITLSLAAGICAVLILLMLRAGVKP